MSTAGPELRRVALVTGSSRGLGATIARLLADDGLAVAVNALRDDEGAEAVAAAIRSGGGAAGAFAADATDEGQAAGLVADVERSLGPIDVLVAKAGGVCEIRGPRCTGTATTADHVIAAFELAERGRLDLFFDTRYLRAACRSCNSRRGAIEENSRRRGRPRPRRRVVTAEQVAVEWAERERAYRARVEQERREAERPRRTPRIF